MSVKLWLAALTIYTAAFLIYKCSGKAEETFRNDLEDNVDALIKRLEDVITSSDLQKRERDGLEDLTEAELEIEIIKKINPMKKWWYVPGRGTGGTETKRVVRYYKNRFSRI